MGMVTYDGLNGTEQNRPVNSLKGSMSVQAEYCGSDRRSYAKLFGTVSRKASINIPRR